MAAYEYSEWKEIIYSEIESNGGWETYAPSVVPDLLEKYADTLDDCKDDYVSLIVGLTIMKLQHYGIENYILERFQKLSGEGFDGYVYISNPQFQEDLKYISKLNVRDVADCTIQNTGKYSRKVDRLLSKYYSKKDRRESVNRKDRLKIIRVTMLSVLGTLVFIGGFVWLCMVNAVVGGSLFALFCVLIFAIAMIRSRNNAGEMDEFRHKYGEDVYGWNGYMPDVNVDSLNEIAEIITNGQATDCTDMNFAWDSSADITLVSFVDALHDLGYGFYYERTPFRFAECINELCARLGYDVVISEEDILANEDKYTKRRRQDGISTHMHDVGMAAKALEQQGYTVIELGLDMDGPYFIVPLDRVGDLQ